MRMHVVDGAEILRRTPEMPAMAPVVAFEHHLRLDGTGYPVRRHPAPSSTSARCCAASPTSTMRCDRSARISGSLPTERILEVLKRDDGHQFDQHLVRRFSQLLGIYPPGNLVLLDDGADRRRAAGARAGSTSPPGACHHGQQAPPAGHADRHQPVRGTGRPGQVAAHRDSARPGRIRRRPAGLSLILATFFWLLA